MADVGPLSPEDVARRRFSTVFRGFDTTEVRTFLSRVAEQLSWARTTESELREQLANVRVQPDRVPLQEDDLMAALGEETARVMRTAQQAAADIRSKAEENVTRILTEAHEQAERSRTQAESVLAQRTHEAEVAAEGIRQAAQAQADALVADAAWKAKEMLAEAEAHRERVLDDLARRTRDARKQLELLQAGRKRLLESYAAVHQSLEEITAELRRADDEARLAGDEAAHRPVRDEDPAPLAPVITLTPVAAPPDASAPPEDPPPPTGDPVLVDAQGHVDETVLAVLTPPEEIESVRLLVPDATLEPAPAPRGPAASGPAPGGQTQTGPRSPAAGATSEAPQPARSGPSSLPPTPPPPSAPSGPSAVVVAAPTAGAHVDPAPATPAASAPQRGASAPSVADAPTSAHPEVRPSPPPSAPAPAAEPATAIEPAPAEARAETTDDAHEADERSRADEPAAGVFAKLRAAAAEPDAAADAVPETEPPAADADEAALAARDAALDELTTSLARRVKRVLQDEQNEVLDRLRSTRGVPGVAELLQAESDHVARYREAVGSMLAEAAAAGARSLAPGSAVEDPPTAEVAADVATELAHAVTGVLRRRLGRAIDVAQGSPEEAALAEAVGAAYREWRAAQVERLVADHLAVAYCAGAFAASAPGTLLQWVVDDADGDCPDCDDNALAGPTVRDEPFPTGQARPPAHPGCRCLVVVVAP